MKFEIKKPYDTNIDRETYKTKITEQLMVFKKEKYPIIIWGFGWLGRRIAFVLKNDGIKVKHYVDSNATEICIDENRYTVEKIADVDIKDAAVLIAIEDRDEYCNMRNMILSNDNKPKFVYYMELIWLYIKVRRMQLSCDEYNRILDMFYEIYHTDCLQLKMVNVMLTECCSLNCRDCIELMPYYKKPMHLDKDKVVDGIKKLCETVDYIEMLTFIGGEPMVSPDLAEILDIAGKMSNIRNIQIITNGTIEPSEKLLEVMRKYNIIFSPSNYGVLSSKREILIKKALASNVTVFTSEQEYIWDFAEKTREYNRTLDENKKIFSKCPHNRASCMLVEDELYVCTKGSQIYRLGIAPKVEGNYVKLDNKEREQIRKDIYQLWNINVINACDYCNNTGKEVEAAIQVPRKYYENR